MTTETGPAIGTTSDAGARPRPHTTHDVLNQPPPRVDVDELASNAPLVDGVRRFDAAWALDELGEVGRLVGSASFQRDAELANTVTPELRAYDRWGNRVDEVDYHPAYHRIIGDAIGHGAHTSAWAQPRPGANVARAATFFLYSQVEPGHACPVSMSHAAVPSLLLQPEVADVWLPRLLSRSYDPELGDGSKQSAVFGMAMTEKQGGSDVRANTTVAVPAGTGGPGATYLLTGHKWFCSAPMSDAFLVLAQASGGEGLSCFLVPRVLADGTRNVLRVQRLKDKLGNRANASSEIELDGTVAVMVGEPGRGVRTIIEMVNRTRLDCIIGSAAGMRQSVAEALWHARNRVAFGRVLVDQPAMTAVLADLALESEAATLAALRLARAYDDDADGTEIAFRRLATAVAKYWVCKRGPHHAYEALECLGGGGYTEEYPLARRYREQPVMAVWEGSGNVIALDVLRALAREGDSLEAFDSEVSAARGAHPLLDAHLDSTRALAARMATYDADEAQRSARRLVESMALALQASLLVRHAPDTVAEAFVGARLAPDRGHQYGVLPTGTATAAVLARA